MKIIFLPISLQLQTSVMGFIIYVCYQNDMNNFAAYCCSRHVEASIAMVFNIMTSQCVLSHYYYQDRYLTLLRYRRRINMN